MEKVNYRLRDNLSWYFKQVWQQYPKYYLVSFFGILVKVGQSLLMVALPTVLVSLLSNKAPLSEIVIIVVSIGLGLAVVNVCQQALDTQVGFYSLAIRTIFQLQTIDKTLDLDYELVENPRVHEIKHIAEEGGVNQNSAGAEAFAKNIHYLIEVFISFVMFGVTLSFFQPLLFVLIIITTFISFYSLKRTRQFRLQHKDEWGKLDTKSYYLKANAYGIENGKDMRLYDMTKWYDRHIEEANKARYEWTKKESTTVLVSQTIQATAVFGRNIIAYVLLISAVIKGALSLTNFTLFFSVMNNVTNYINEIGEYSHLVLKANQDLNDLRFFLELANKTLRQRDQPEKWTNMFNSDQLSFTFEDVCYRYSDATEDTITNLSFHLEKGEKVALVGSNGAGKSTVVKLLSGLIQPTKGRVLVNGVDIVTLPLEDYYECVAPVFQESLIFAFDLAVNVAMTDSYDEARLWTCLELAGLGNKVRGLPNGIGTQMKQYLREDGLELSGGETQKLMISRALYKDAPLLILDEPTAALDALAESELYEKYGQLAAGKTSLFISHRLASTRFCQRILFLAEGEIVEAGTHEQLMAKKGRYANMYHIQSHYYQEEVE